MIAIPGFLGTDFYLGEFRAWLRRIGYKPYFSGIGLNAECPNLLIRTRLNETIEQAYKSSKKKVHLVGHSLGGVIARAMAAQRPELVASVISLGSPFRGVSIHPSVLRAAEYIRGRILERHGGQVLPDCYTDECTCDFLESLETTLPACIRQTAVYTKTDGIVDWRVCTTGDCDVDFEVSATHLGLVFNPIVYRLVAERLAGECLIEREVRSARRSSKGRIRRLAERPVVAVEPLQHPRRAGQRRKGVARKPRG